MSTSSLNRVTMSNALNIRSLPPDILEHLASTQASLIIISNLSLQLIQLRQLRWRRTHRLRLLRSSILINHTRPLSTTTPELTKPTPALLLDQTRPSTQEATRTIRPSNARQILIRPVMVRVIRIIRVEGLPRQKASDAAWSRCRCGTQGRVVDCGGCSTAAVVDSICSARRGSGMAIDGCCGRAVCGLVFTRRRRRFLFFNGRVGGRRDIGAFGEREADGCECGKSESLPKGLAVCRHCLFW